MPIAYYDCATIGQTMKLFIMAGVYRIGAMRREARPSARD
jgi:hypothetical protein